jgi:hypothetical protein
MSIHHILRRLIAIFILYSSQSLYAQLSDTRTDRVTPKEFTIPANPVFDLMGVVPSQVTRLGDIKDFKVDWSFRSWRLNPNLAIQAQPIWEMLYHRKDLTKYQNASGFMRRLAGLDVSFGTVQNEQNDRRIGFAVKANIIRGKDPLLVKDVYNDIYENYNNQKQMLEEQLAVQNQQLKEAANDYERFQIRQQIRSTEEQLRFIKNDVKAQVAERAKIIASENWNAPSLDIAFGRIYTYQTDENGTLLSLRLNRNTAWGVWMNGGTGIGKNVYISGMFRANIYEEQLNFQLQDQETFETTERQAIASNALYTIGANIRYGSPVYTFFAEFVYEWKGVKTAVDALGKVFTPLEGETLVPGTVKWDVVPPYSFSAGGDWRVSRNVILNYGVRCLLNNEFKLQTFTPVVSVACMMR